MIFLWMSRSHNKVADGFADKTMDQTRSCERCYNTSPDSLNSSWLVQTDGGLRSEHCSAASLVIGIWTAVGDAYKYEPWCAEGINHLRSHNVQAEDTALNQAAHWCGVDSPLLRQRDDGNAQLCFAQ
eukprot:TRINITY_DN57022_c0_g1_i1.p2 TRINITY_DN57022_c0_g1~~TRINITY_DN57022_c0_g1_i1.p2  ORF type:complete len:127 (+),score=7.05 TRINITY_DN57022_c0_g1_i1:211-591(+)